VEVRPEPQTELAWPVPSVPVVILDNLPRQIVLLLQTLCALLVLLVIQVHMHHQCVMLTMTMFVYSVVVALACQ
jgi:hypothetical protein